MDEKVKRHAILITAYTDDYILHRLIDRLKNDFNIYVHIDKKSSLKVADLEENNVYVYKKYRVNWASFNHLAAIIYLIKKASNNKEIEYFHIISGQDFPTVSNTKLMQFFERNEGKSYLDFEKVCEMDDSKRKGMQNRYELRWFTNWLAYPKTFDFQSKKIIGFIERIQLKYKIKRNKIGEFSSDKIYKGMVYCSLHKNAVRYILDYTNKENDFLQNMRTVLIPEEFSFQTILMNSPLKDTLINNNLRYMNWEYRNDISPCILDERDYETVQKSQCLFMRKISVQSEKLIDLLNK